MSENGAVRKYLMLRALADAQARQVRFLVPGLIPLKTLTLVAGVGGLGKSTWLAGIAARLSRGDLGEHGNVIIVSFEDTTEEMLRPRVEAAQGDLSRVFDIVVPEHQGPVVLPSDLRELEACVHDAQARLLIVDPIVAAIDTAFDAHKDQHVRSVLAQLAALAKQENLAVAMVGHLNKAPSREAYIRVANSVAFWNASRSVVLITEDSEEPDSQRLVAQRKANLARLAPIERHRIESIILPHTVDPETGNPIETSRMVFLEYAHDVDANDLLGPPRERQGAKESLATGYLTAALNDGDWHDSARLKTVAGTVGISEPTLKRAAQTLAVEHKRKGFPSSTWWRLPQLAHLSTTKLEPTVDPAQPSGFEGSPASSQLKSDRDEPTDEQLDLGTAPLGELLDHFREDGGASPPEEVEPDEIERLAELAGEAQARTAERDQQRDPMEYERAILAECEELVAEGVLVQEQDRCDEEVQA